MLYYEIEGTTESHIMQMAPPPSCWREQYCGGITEQERELYERVRNAANEAEREGDAQLQAAVAAAGAVRQAVRAPPTHLDRWSLKFNSQRLEAAYRLKSTTNAGNYDHLPVLLKLAVCMPHLSITVGRLWSPENLDWKVYIPPHSPDPVTYLEMVWRTLQSTCQPCGPMRTVSPASESELTFCELWAMCAAVVCVAVLAVQLMFPQWYKSNRGATLKYLVVLLWVWESVKLSMNTSEIKYIVTEVVFVNVFMSFLHRVPFTSHLQARSIGCGAQIIAIMSKGFNSRIRLQIMCFAFGGHLLGLGLAYFLDRSSRKGFLSSLPVWLLEEINGSGTRPQFFISYRTSLSRQLWSIFYPELLDNWESTTNKAVTYDQIAPRRVLGGFAGGFGGVSSLKCTGPISTSLSPICSSSSLSTRSSDSSSGNWAGVGPNESGLSYGEIVSNAHESSGYQRRESARWDSVVATSVCSQVGGMETSQPPQYMRSRGPTEAASKRDYY